MIDYAAAANFHFCQTANFGCYIYCRDANGYNVCIHRVANALEARLWISAAKSKLNTAMSR